MPYVRTFGAVASSDVMPTGKTSPSIYTPIQVTNSATPPGILQWNSSSPPPWSPLYSKWVNSSLGPSQAVTLPAPKPMTIAPIAPAAPPATTQPIVATPVPVTAPPAATAAKAGLFGPAAGAAGGFVVGGPIGAAVGAGIGYFLTK